MSLIYFQVFPGNCYSEEAIGAAGTYPPNRQNASKSALFAEMAEASRMIAGADDLLYEGEMPYSNVAILYPRSSWMWDVVNGTDHDNHDIDEDQGETEMDCASAPFLPSFLVIFLCLGVKWWLTLG